MAEAVVVGHLKGVTLVARTADVTPEVTVKVLPKDELGAKVLEVFVVIGRRHAGRCPTSWRA